MEISTSGSVTNHHETRKQSTNQCEGAVTQPWTVEHCSRDGLLDVVRHGQGSVTVARLCRLNAKSWESWQWCSLTVCRWGDHWRARGCGPDDQSGVDCCPEPWQLKGRGNAGLQYDATLFEDDLC